MSHLKHGTLSHSTESQKTNSFFFFGQDLHALKQHSQRFSNASTAVDVVIPGLRANASTVQVRARCVCTYICVYNMLIISLAILTYLFNNNNQFDKTYFIRNLLNNKF